MFASYLEPPIEFPNQSSIPDEPTCRYFHIFISHGSTFTELCTGGTPANFDISSWLFRVVEYFGESDRAIYSKLPENVISTIVDGRI